MNEQLQSPSAWLDELAQFLNDAVSAHGFQRLSIRMARDHVAEVPAEETPFQIG